MKKYSKFQIVKLVSSGAKTVSSGAILVSSGAKTVSSGAIFARKLLGRNVGFCFNSLTI